MSPFSKAIVSFGALSMVVSPVIASASGSILPAEASRPIGASFALDNDEEDTGAWLPIVGVVVVAVVLGLVLKGKKRSR